MPKEVFAEDIKTALSRKYSDGWFFLTEITQPHRYICEAWIHDFPEDETIGIDEWITISKMPVNERPKERRLDAYAIAYWGSRDASAIGFEIKVNRSDFLSEVNGSRKYEAWLPYCDRFYFACSPKVASIDEIPEECGLLIISHYGRGYRTQVAKFAPRRKIERPPWRLMAKTIYKTSAEIWRLKYKISELEKRLDKGNGEPRR